MKNTWRISLFVTMLAVLTAFSGFSLGEDGGVLQIRNGMLQPILRYTDPRAENYTNEGSDILRFCVYVETDYDTDGDGKPDLAKAFVQLPRPAAEGKYRAAVIYDPTPYAAGTCEMNNDNSDALHEEVPFDYARLSAPGEKRTPAGEMTALEAAKAANPRDWNYTVPKNATPSYSYMPTYDYFLVRGYAVVMACGIGTYGSEGFELCGMTMECDSHKAVVEWLAGDRVAYTDPNSCVAIRADWCNGSVAMTGASYGGAIPFEVATTGVKGLKTIVPVAGVASWYEYTNSQGIPITFRVAYADSLAAYNCGGVYTDEEWTTLKPGYGSWLWQIAKDQENSNGDFAPVWDMLEYGKNAQNITCSALIVQGLNDFNVMSRHADLMMQAFTKAGQTCRLLLHQDGHISTEAWMVNGELWYETLNKWYAHYLYGVDNGIENMAAVTVQSNVDGTWKTYDHWRDFRYQTFPARGIDMGDTARVDSAPMATKAAFLKVDGKEEEALSQDDFYISLEGEQAAKYTIDLPENTTIYGVPEIHLRLAMEKPDLDGQMITAVLVDSMKEEGAAFPAYVPNPLYDGLVEKKVVGTVVVGGGVDDQDQMVLVQTDAKHVTFTYGWTDLTNPDCGSESAEYVQQEGPWEAGEYYDYTIYLQPVVYTLAPGHQLTLVLTTWDPFRAFLDEDFELDPTLDPAYSTYTYAMTVDNTALEVRLPIAE